MKKLLLSGAALLLTGMFSAQAQTVQFSENFNDWTAVSEDWYNVDFDGDGEGWGRYTGFNDPAVAASLNIDGGFYMSWSWAPEPAPNGTVLTPDNHLITPVIQIPEASTTSVRVKMGGQNETYYAEKFFIYAITVSAFEDFLANTDGGLDAWYAALGAPLYEHVLTQAPAENFTVNLDGFAGNEVHIVIRHGDVSDVLSILFDEIEVLSNPLSTNDLSKDAISTYPNPTKDVINFASNEGLVINSVEVRDINGRTVKTAKVSNNSISVADLASGVYTMTISTEKGSTVKKFIKQ